MITELTITNFQAHHKLRLGLDPHITTIVGPSDVGKSAVIRALRWLVFNRPVGTDFINWDKPNNTAEVTAFVGPLCAVTRRRGPGVNSYSITDHEAYNAFGNDVPPAVAEVLNLGEVNFQRQHDSPFWFTETAGEVSRRLNQIIDLAIIDTTLANLAAAIRQARTEAEITAGRLAEAQAERGRWAYARQMSAGLAELEAQEVALTALTAKCALVLALLGDARTYRGERDRAAEANVAANSAYVAGVAWGDSARKRAGLEALATAGRAQASAAARPVPDPRPLEAGAAAVGAAAAIVSQLAALTQQAAEQERTWRKVHHDLTAAKAAARALIGTPCPTCGQPIRS